VRLLLERPELSDTRLRLVQRRRSYEAKLLKSIFSLMEAVVAGAAGLCSPVPAVDLAAEAAAC